ncbi:protein-L-isoaspartate O-methyltransferase [Kaustia mangrovi]|uniref:Protein-L-isoaspartate O-methyltransferase n=1 Tax=Kaustia mangrovi TaxID=2593653 RepID=A0A7S8C1M2_9HYPH|nr:protein-L-isoaspartate O-methyltransferase [Kaustia mangrovi]QPC41696.1 protein-L-isoaspartate O-methyltransferase [Kaustia mangrovi]
MTDFQTARTNMVESQIRPSGITDHRIIAAMSEVPREAFVPRARQQLAYMDEDLPLTEAVDGAPPRYLMEPMSFARLLQLAGIDQDELVLDVGCALGYSTAVISRLAQSVVALEADGDLADRAGELLVEHGVMNAAVVTGPLRDGHKAEGPYDVIVVNGAVPEIPAALFDQLKDNGRLVAVVEPENGVGKTTLFTRHGTAISSRQSYDANVPALPGFEVERPRFVF